MNAGRRAEGHLKREEGVSETQFKPELEVTSRGSTGHEGICMNTSITLEHRQEGPSGAQAGGSI